MIRSWSRNRMSPPYHQHLSSKHFLDATWSFLVCLCEHKYLAAWVLFQIHWLQGDVLHCCCWAGLSTSHRDVWASPSRWSSYVPRYPRIERYKFCSSASSFYSSVYCSLSTQAAGSWGHVVCFSYHWVQDDDGRSHVFGSADFPSMGDLIMAVGLNIHVSRRTSSLLFNYLNF